MKTKVILNDQFQMLMNINSRMWHVIHWENVDSEGDGRYIERSLCKGQRVTLGIALNGDIIGYKPEVDISKIDCSTCQKKYESVLVRELRKELNAQVYDS